ncbi:hypothetical protein Tco_1202288 [Tanacetum coccineum]
MGKGSAIPTDPRHTPTFIQPSTQPQKIQKPRKPKRKDTQVPQPSDPIESVADEVVHKELGDSLVRAAITTSSLKAEQDSGGGPWCQETIRELLLKLVKKGRRQELKRKNRVPKNHRLKRLYKVGLTARVESSDNEESLGASKQGRIDAIDADEEITLVSVHDVNVSACEDAVLLHICLMIFLWSQVLEDGKDKGKGILIEPVKPVNKKDLIRLDEETALNLQAEFDDEERLCQGGNAKKEEEANIALIENGYL